jgi:tetratricopeptide (TPR) repeat protein
MWKSHGDVSEILGTDETLYRSMELSLEDLESSYPVAANLLALFSFLDHRDFWYELCLNAADDTFPQWLQNLAGNKTPFRHYYPLLADLSFIELKISANGSRTWETHPAIQAVVRRRFQEKEREYIRSAISLVADQVPGSSMANSWPTIRRLLPHAQICWSYVKAGKWGSSTNLTELESLARVFRQTGHYEEASIIYRMIARGLDNHSHTPESLEFFADVLANLGLVYTHQHKSEAALGSFDRSSSIMSELGTLTPHASMSIMYNKAVVFMMTDRLDEAETYLRDAAEYFAYDTSENTLIEDERRSLYFRILNDLGEVMLRKGSIPEALRVFQHVYYGLGDFSRQGDPQPAQISLKLNMGRALTRLGDFSKARELLEEVISIYTEWWGRRHPETMRVIDELAWTLMNECKDKQAKGDDIDSEVQRSGELWNEALDFYRRIGGDASDTVARIEANLSQLFSNIGNSLPLYLPSPNSTS